MLQVPSLNLPKSLPYPKAIQSYKDNLHSYEPVFWELQYKICRYLERVPDELLIERYKDILRNMRALISLERNIIPIQSFLSSWYWFRKEHQTRLEFSLRGILLPVAPPLGLIFNNEGIGAPIRPKHPNAGNILFRYDKTIHIKNIAHKGQIRIRPASDFGQMDGDSARQDKECSKKSFLAGAHTRITTHDGHNIPIEGCLERTVSMPDYYVFCMACDWDEEFFTDFGDVDACLIIKDAEYFADSIETAAAAQLPGWYFHHNPVEYFDPYEISISQYINAGIYKDFRFAYQREYRFLWSPPSGIAPDGFKFLELGNLDNLAEIYPKRNIAKGALCAPFSWLRSMLMLIGFIIRCARRTLHSYVTTSRLLTENHRLVN